MTADTNTVAIVEDIRRRLAADPDVVGVLLTGSVARGDSPSRTDIDFEAVVVARREPRFLVEWIDGRMIEIHYRSEDEWEERLASNPMSWYAFSDGRILFEKDEALTRLAQIAEANAGKFRWPGEKVGGVLHWLRSTKVKLEAASAAADDRRASLVLSTSIWTVLEALWIVNGRSIPPLGGVFAHLKDLVVLPPDFERDFDRLLVGALSERLDSAHRLIDWEIEMLVKTAQVEEVRDG